MLRQKVYEEELAKLIEIFKDVEPTKVKLVHGLIQDAAFLYAENYILKESLNKTGMIKFHPTNLTMQKSIPAAKEYRQNLNSYAIIIRTLDGVLMKDIVEEEDDMDDYE